MHIGKNMASKTVNFRKLISIGTDIKIVEENDYSLIDGTFAEQDELPGRDMSKIPHPFIVETMDILKPMKEKSKVHFIHLNHTNTALMPNSRINDELKTLGYKIASRGLKLKI